MTDYYNRKFFADPAVQATIDTLADSKPLVLFLGAGVSASQGLPTWTRLLDRLVARGVAQMKGISKGEKEQVVKEILSRPDPLVLGSIARSFSSEATLRTRLYQRLYVPGKPRHPSLVFLAAIWELILTRERLGLETTVVTTNYDDLLERAPTPSLLAFAGLSGVNTLPKPKPVYSESTLNALVPGEFPIYHLHGFIPEGSSFADVPNDQEIVLTTRDFGNNWQTHWTAKIFAEKWDWQWAFCGMSFQDPHIASILVERQARLGKIGIHHTDDPMAPIGIFSLQGQPWVGLPPRVVSALATIEVERLGQLGMNAQPTRYYYQDAWYLHEVSSATRDNGSFRPYPERVDSWGEEFYSRWIADRKLISELFVPVARQMLDDVEGDLLSARSPMNVTSGESFKVELWCRDPDSRSLLCISTTEVVVTNIEGTKRLPLSASADNAALKAFTEGRPRILPPHANDRAQKRWKVYFAAPIVLFENEWNWLPVGVLVCASDRKRGASTISDDWPDLQANLLKWRSWAVALLDPRAPGLTEA